MTTAIPTTIPIDDLPESTKTMAACYARGDESERIAILLRVFEGLTVRAVAQKTGLTKDKVDRLAKGFKEVYGAQLERRGLSKINTSTPEVA